MDYAHNFRLRNHAGCSTDCYDSACNSGVVAGTWERFSIFTPKLQSNGNGWPAEAVVIYNWYHDKYLSINDVQETSTADTPNDWEAFYINFAADDEDSPP